MSTVVKQERLMKILIAPHISEKSNNLMAKQQYVFRVFKNASKPEIASAIELMFNVVVDHVRVSNVKGKVKKVGRIVGRRNHWKKAYIRLAEGHKIDIVEAQP